MGGLRKTKFFADFQYYFCQGRVGGSETAQEFAEVIKGWSLSKFFAYLNTVYRRNHQLTLQATEISDEN